MRSVCTLVTLITQPSHTRHFLFFDTLSYSTQLMKSQITRVNGGRRSASNVRKVRNMHCPTCAKVKSTGIRFQRKASELVTRPCHLNIAPHGAKTTTESHGIKKQTHASMKDPKGRNVRLLGMKISKTGH